MSQTLIAQGQGGDSLNGISQWDSVFSLGDDGILQLSFPDTPFDLIGQIAQKLSEEIAAKVGGTVSRSGNVIEVKFTVNERFANSGQLAHFLPLGIGLAVLAATVIRVLILFIVVKSLIDLVGWVLYQVKRVASWIGDALEKGDLTGLIPIAFGGVLLYAVWSAFTEQSRGQSPVIVIRR